METTITTKPDLILSDRQEDALVELLLWTTGDELFHILKGAAGTGKTTVLNEYIKRSPYKNKTVITAPTHKAKKIASDITGLQGVTIQSLLGLRPNTELETFDINKPQFDPIAAAMIGNHRVVIIDEASMLNEDLHTMICDEAEEIGVKILFVGDTLQLPPVNEEISRALFDHNATELTEIIRQDETNPLHALLLSLRNDIVNGTESFISLIRDTPEVLNDKGGYTILERREFTEAVVSHFGSEEFMSSKDKTYAKYVAWTNESVREWNKFIRKSLFTTDKVVTKGDLLMGYKTLAATQYTTAMINSEDYIVESVEEMQNFDKVDVLSTTGKATISGIPFLFHIVNPNNYIDFLSQERKLLTEALDRRGKSWVTYYKFKDKHALMEDINRNQKLLLRKDIDYGYAITVHKTQGSTFENVFVNVPNIMKNNNPLERKKLVYVALSRASSKVFILK